jgi:transposase
MLDTRWMARLLVPTQWSRQGGVLVELSVMEQRYQAVLAVVQDGWKVVEVADRLGVSRQTVHNWIARYEQGGLVSLTDRSRRPTRCPQQISPDVEAIICPLRREHPGWGPRRIEHQLLRSGIDPVPGRSSIYRCLRRHGLIELRRRRKRRDEFRRWERERPMQLWQLDVMGGVELEDGTELKVVTGVDDHSRFWVAAKLVSRATSKAVCALGRGVTRFERETSGATAAAGIFLTVAGSRPSPRLPELPHASLPRRSGRSRRRSTRCSR